MYNFCTLFNSNYLTRGIALYESLKKYCKNFKLYVFAFDNECVDILNYLSLENMVVISPEEFEDEELLSVKSTRTRGEYCWTCTPSTILYVLKKYEVKSCTYLDADLYFYDSPEILFKELGSDSVLITEHRYTEQYDQSNISGKYCVQFMTFKNDERGLRVLNWWRNACIDWCYARIEDGKFGDQKYLDDWIERFEGIHELKYLGGGVAPWNVQQYKFCKENSNIIGLNERIKEKFNLIFYHFHNLIFYKDGNVDLSTYILSKDVIDLIYKDYLKHLYEINLKLEAINSTLNANNQQQAVNKIKSVCRKIKRKIKGNYNIYYLNKIIK